MIPIFQRAVAAQVRDLVKAGRAIHVTEADAVELEMIAGLFEGHGPVQCEIRDSQEIGSVGGIVTIPAGALRAGDVLQIEGAITNSELVRICNVTPADFAYAWLLLSRAIPTWPENGGPAYSDGYHEINVERLQRAAVCAELVALGSQIVPSIRVHSPVPSEAEQKAMAEVMAQWGQGLMPKLPAWTDVEIIPGSVSPHQGSLEGARAAWSFVVDQCEQQMRTLLANLDRCGGKTGYALPLAAVRDKYRRELEAMK